MEILRDRVEFGVGTVCHFLPAAPLTLAAQTVGVPVGEAVGH